MATSSVPLECGTFLLSLDTEFAWGDADFPKKRYAEGQKKERELTLRLLQLLQKYQIPATFAVVGALYHEETETNSLPEKTQQFLQRNWPNRFYVEAFCTKDFHAPELMEILEKDSLGHDLGSHSYTHIIFTTPECTPEIATWEFQEARKIAQKRGYASVSFVFPRNQCEYLPLLFQAGFQVYRGEDPAWFNQMNLGKWPKKIGHILDLIFALTPPCSLPQREENGLLNLQGSMNYLSMAGWRRYIPLFCRVQQAKKGIQRAIQKKRLFHLWFHPSHLGSGTELLFSGLETIFAQVAEEREKGHLAVETMASLAQKIKGEQTVIRSNLL